MDRAGCAPRRGSIVKTAPQSENLLWLHYPSQVLNKLTKESITVTYVHDDSREDAQSQRATMDQRAMISLAQGKTEGYRASWRADRASRTLV